ncbi:ribonuclease H-like domain-containing protein [bacterium]
MDLKEKLKFYESAQKPSVKKDSMSQDAGIHLWVEGEEHKNEFGQFYLVKRSFPKQHQHGSQSLGSNPKLPESIYAWVGKDAKLQSLNPLKSLYLDTETTGLAGGAGTVPFMIGLGYFTDNGFNVEQFFMRDYPEERAMLSAFLKRLSEFDGLVTYNGKCYDVNLIASRLILHRMEYPITQLPHLDLLFTARRLYKRRLSDCSLGNIEHHILGFTRHGDVPGFLIPGIYFHYLRSGQGERLKAVFEHNQWDILSLAALTMHAGHVYSEPSKILENTMDWYSLGRAYESLDLNEQAVHCFQKVVQSGDLSGMEDALYSLGFIYKKKKQWDQAIHCWEQMIKRPFQLLPYEELAKYYEHQVRDNEKAMEWVMKALERIDMQIELQTNMVLENDRQKLIYRYDRLKRKLKEMNDENP